MTHARTLVTSLGLLVAVSALFAPRLGAQSQVRPDLSGQWVIAEAPDGTGLAPFGRTFTALQDDSILTLELTSLFVMGHTQVTERHPRLTYRLDGSEGRHPLLALARPVSAMSPSATGFRTQDWVTRAAWEGGRLVIVTYAERSVRDQALDPDASTHRTMMRQELWIDQAGQLVVETSTNAEPVLSLAEGSLAQRLAVSGDSRVVYRRVASNDAGR